MAASGGLSQLAFQRQNSSLSSEFLTASLCKSHITTRPGLISYYMLSQLDHMCVPS
jgi:hypothetical protein